MSSSSTNLERDSSLDGKTASIDTLPTLSGGYTESTFIANKWGYKKASENYNAYQSGTIISTSSTATSGNTTTLSFASKIDNNQPAGSYSLDLTFTVVANPLVDYIQNFTKAMCEEKASSADYTVIDKRDNNDYTVRYINGNCWMTQNLRYIGDTGSTPGNMVMKTATSNIDADTSLKYYHFGDSQCTRTGATGLTNLCIETGGQ